MNVGVGVGMGTGMGLAWLVESEIDKFDEARTGTHARARTKKERRERRNERRIVVCRLCSPCGWYEQMNRVDK